MNLNRQIPPPICPLSDIHVTYPESQRLKNGIPLHVIRAGMEDVVRFDLLIGAGQWHQTQALQAMFTNRMLREGTSSLTYQQIA